MGLFYKLILSCIVFLSSKGDPDMHVVVSNDEELQAYLSYNRGVELEQAGELQLARIAYENALEKKADLLEAMNNIGGICKTEGNIDCAKSFYNMLLRESSEMENKWLQAAANNNLGLIEFIEATGGVVDAEPVAVNAPRIRDLAMKHYQQAIDLDHNLIDAHYNLANSFQLLGEDDKAYEKFLDVLSLDPDHVRANMNLANLFIKRNRFDLASEYHARVVEKASVKGESAKFQSDALNNLGQTLREAGDIYGAIASHEQAQETSPHDPIGYAHALVARRGVCQWKDWLAHHIHLVELLQRSNKTGVELGPYDSLLMPVSFFTGRERPWLRDFARQAIAGFHVARGTQPGGRKVVTLGYLSYDMREHPMGYLTHGLYVNHDRSQFEVNVYMYGERDGSEQRLRIERDVDKFIDMLGVPTDAAGAQLVNDKVDILVDLMAHTRGARVDIAAQVPPGTTYVNYLGYPGTSGFDFQGAYYMGDAVVTPVESLQGGREFSETALLIPGSYQANEYNASFAICLQNSAYDAHRCRSKSSLTQAIPERFRGAFRFANLNVIQKMEPESFGLWMNILRRAPHSILFLLQESSKIKGNATANLKLQAAARGIDPGRIVFLPRVSKADHLSRLVGIDVFLDSLIYGAHSTASDALWAGVPVLSVRGGAFPSRVGASLNEALGLSELVTDSVKVFEDIAVELSYRPSLVSALKAKLVQSLWRKQLFRPDRSTRAVENGLLAAHELAAVPLRVAVILPEKEGQDQLLETLEKELENAASLLRSTGDAEHVGFTLKRIAATAEACQKHTRRCGMVLANALQLLGVAGSDANYILEAISLSQYLDPRPPISQWLANAAHIFRLSGRLSRARATFRKAISRTLLENVDGFAIHVESLVHISKDLGQSETEQLAEFLRLYVVARHQQLSDAEKSAIYEESGFWPAIQSVVDRLVSFGKHLGAASLLKDAALLATPSPFRFRLMYQSGALFNVAKHSRLALNIHLDTVKAENLYFFQQVTRPRPVDHAGRRIVIYCYEYGQTWWPNWGPNSPKQGGAGGSEEAVIFLSRELANLGWLVEIYADPLEADLGIDKWGVLWRKWTEYDVNDKPDVFVAWRYHISLALAVNAKVKLLWLHDIVSDLGEQIALLPSIGLVDAVLGGSRFHLRSFANSIQNISFVLGYALQESYFVDGTNARNEFIYASAPNRGLQALLSVWPQIREKIPDARLAIYYGFSPSFMKWGIDSIPNFQQWVHYMKETIARLNSFGVDYIGMVEHHELATAYARAGFSLYPTSFPETGCVSLMKAQAMGAIPITSRFENSSIPDLTHLWDLGPYPAPNSAPIEKNATFLQEWAQAVIRAATRVDLQHHRASMKEWARTELLWSAVARRLVSTIDKVKGP